MNIFGRLLYIQTVTILADCSQVWKVSLQENRYAARWLVLLWRTPWIVVMLYSFSRATDIARSFRFIVQLHRLIHIGRWTKLFRQFTFQSDNLCGSGNGRILPLPRPQEKDRFQLPLHFPLPHPWFRPTLQQRKVERSAAWNRDEHWTGLGLDWIRTMTNFDEFGLDPACKLLQKFRIRANFGLI